MYDIVIGRNEEDKKKYGLKGCIYFGKHYVQMGHNISLSNKIYLDMIRSHVIFICGKRGGGKSYTLGVFAEGMAILDDEVRQNLSILLLDTMGIFWTMKYPNHKESEMLKEWEIEAKPLDKAVRIATPYKFHEIYKKRGIPTDFGFSIKPSELQAADWCLSFDISINDSVGVLIEKTITDLKEKTEDFSIRDIVDALRKDKEVDDNTRNATINRFLGTELWGLFSKEGTSIRDLAAPGMTTILDVSCYATMENGWKVKALAIGLIAQRLFLERMLARKNEEYQEIKSQTHYFTEEDTAGKKQEFPLVWLIIDEAHEFLPREGKTAASDALITILREGRQPGISLVLATQQPAKIHTDVMTQSDTFISHRLTAKIDTEALGMLMQSYMREGLDVMLDSLPRVRGSALIFDDTNEKLYQVHVRPRFTWHGGESPIAIHKKKEIFNF